MNLSNLLATSFLSPGNTGPRHEDSGRHGHKPSSFHNLKDDTVSLSQQAKVAYNQSSTSQNHIEILTRDGDKVTVSLTTQSSYQARIQYSDVQTQDARQTQYTASESQQSSRQFNIRIEGNIDEEERDAINQLIHNISDIAQELYQGNIESAFNHASSLEYNTDELQSYAFDLSQANTRQYTAVYEEVARMQSDKATDITTPSSSLDLMDLLNELAENTIKTLNEFLESKQLESLIGQANKILEKDLQITANNHLFKLLEPGKTKDD